MVRKVRWAGTPGTPESRCRRRISRRRSMPWSPPACAMPDTATSIWTRAGRPPTAMRTALCKPIRRSSRTAWRPWPNTRTTAACCWACTPAPTTKPVGRQRRTPAPGTRSRTRGPSPPGAWTTSNTTGAGRAATSAIRSASSPPCEMRCAPADVTSSTASTRTAPTGTPRATTTGRESPMSPATRTICSRSGATHYRRSRSTSSFRGTSWAWSSRCASPHHWPRAAVRGTGTIRTCSSSAPSSPNSSAPMWARRPVCCSKRFR